LVRGKNVTELGPSFFAVNRLNMADMLRAFDQLAPDDRNRFSQAAFDGIPAQGCGFSSTLPQAKQVNIDRIKFAYRTVVDKKVPAEVPGDLYETGQLKDAYEYLGVAPSLTKSVWATCIGSVCEDAQLRKKGDSNTVMGADQTYGQAGWEVGIMYGTSKFSTLPELIKKRCNGFFVKRLALNAHGAPGSFAVNGVDEKGIAFEPAMKADNLRVNFNKELDFLNNVMTQDGTLLLAGCEAGRDTGWGDFGGFQGTKLLTQLSLELEVASFAAFVRSSRRSSHA
jgi:hypothetical protein